MHLLVGGGRGFIGGYVATELARRGHRVVVSGSDDTATIATTGFDTLVWCGGRRGADPEALHAAHVAAPLATLGQSRARTIVYLSSGECYGNGEPPFREVSPLLGTSPYARAKIEAEDALRQWAAERPGERSATALRLGVVYGPGQSGAMLVPSLLAAIGRRQPFPATWGGQTRDLVAAEDVARAVAACLGTHARAETDPCAWRAYNIASGHETRVADVIGAVLAAAATATGEPIAALAGLVQLGALPYRENEQMRYVLAVERAAADLGWRAEVPLAAGLAATVRAALATR